MNNKKPGYSLLKKGFTLIEMLIVIVIIGILAAALIPRLTSARGRANDTARKASIQQIATALISYQIDNGSFPVGSGGISNIKDKLLQGGLSSLPKDPQADMSFGGISPSTVGGGDFGYTRIEKNGSANNGIAIMAKVETEKAANRLVCENDPERLADCFETDCTTCDELGNITSETKFEDIHLCNSVTKGTSKQRLLDGNCIYIHGDDLRYLYIY